MLSCQCFHAHDSKRFIRRSGVVVSVAILAAFAQYIAQRFDRKIAVDRLTGTDRQPNPVFQAVVIFFTRFLNHPIRRGTISLIHHSPFLPAYHARGRAVEMFQRRSSIARLIVLRKI